MSESAARMDEGHRRQYLHAMGIQLWMPRTPASRHDLPQDPPADSPTPGDIPARPAQDRPVALDALRQQVSGCTRCSQLAGTRCQTVFGVGDPSARLMIIGEAPGAEEDRRGEPFVGRAGQLLDNMLAAIGLHRGQDVYIANILKCCPPGNRDPLPEEARACREYLDAQIDLIEPGLILALGRVAAQNLLATEATLGDLRQKPREYRGMPVVVTYHPAYLLRRPLDKRKAWADLCLTRELMTGIAGAGMAAEG